MMIFVLLSSLFSPNQASQAQLILYKLSKNDSNLESTILGINFPITQQHFVRGKLKVNGDENKKINLTINGTKNLDGKNSIKFVC